jgi:hypothetical protein
MFLAQKYGAFQIERRLAAHQHAVPIQLTAVTAAG